MSVPISDIPQVIKKSIDGSSQACLCCFSSSSTGSTSVLQANTKFETDGAQTIIMSADMVIWEETLAHTALLRCEEVGIGK